MIHTEQDMAVGLPVTTLPRRSTWRSALIVAFGASLLVVVSVGPMAADLGPASVVVWSLTAFVGVLQCLLIADLGVRFPNHAGGTATYAHAAFRDVSPLLGAVSSWAYWFAWTPGIAVNLLLAAQYLQASVLPWVNPFVLAGVLAAALYGLNALGLRPSIASASLLAICALIPLAGIALAPVLRPELFNPAFLQPFVPRDGSWIDGGTWVRLLKWMFVASWASYGAEMASTVIAELRDPRRDVPRAMGGAALIALVAYSGVPLALLLIVGPDGLAQDPVVALLPAARAIFGSAGAMLVVLLLVAALLLGAQAFMIGSSRTLYQMSRDGLMIRQCARLNRFGVPIGSMVFDAVVTIGLLAIFGARLIEIVAAANVGYLVVFVLLPLTWLRLRRGNMEHTFGMQRWGAPLAWGLFGCNLTLLLVGGAQWGPVVMGTGILGTLAILPLLWLRRRQDRIVPR